MHFSQIKLAELIILIEDDMEEIISFVKYCLHGMELFTFFSYCMQAFLSSSLMYPFIRSKFVFWMK